MKKIADENPMMSALKVLESATFYFDYENKNTLAEIKILSSDEKKNQQIMDFLQGIKAFGAMAVTKKPELEDLLNRIEITSGTNDVTIYVRVPQELMDKIRDLMKERKS